MFRILTNAIISKIEKVLGVTNDYMRFIANTSTGAFIDFMLFMKLANHRERMPAEALHVARITSAQALDCGTCVQTNVNLALRDGMRADYITAVLENKPDSLPIELQEIYEFTGHLLRHTYEEDALRESIRGRYGDAGLIDLAYGIASAQVFPLTKKVLGYAKSCSKVEVVVPGATRGAQRTLAS